jgi:hypothetical protein
VYIYAENRRHIQSILGGKVNILRGHSIGYSKPKCVCVCVCVCVCHIPNFFRDRAISRYSSNLLIRKRYYVLFLIPLFIVQVKKLVQFT